jgi:hypothetical protein
VVARCVVESALKRGKNFRVTDDAAQLLERGHDEFSTVFGDSFVRGLHTGGEFYCVVRVTSVSPAKQNELAAMVHAAFNGLFTGAEVKAAFEKAHKDAHTRAELSMTMYQKPGTGPQISLVVTIEDVVNRYRTFPEIAHNDPAAYETELVSYNTLGLPLPPLEEREDFLFALRDAREKKLHYIQKRNDLQFALENPMLFGDLPPRGVLRNVVEVYIKLINAVTDHSKSIFRQQNTRIFDPEELSPSLIEPGPIPYKLPALGV